MSAETDGPNADTSPDDANSEANSAGAGAGDPDTARGESAGTAAEETAATKAEGSTESHQLHPALIATAVALPVALIVAILVIAVMSRQPAEREPLALGSVPAPAAGGEDCTRLLAAVPSTLAEDYTRSELAEPAPPGSVA